MTDRVRFGVEAHGGELAPCSGISNSNGRVQAARCRTGNVTDPGCSAAWLARLLWEQEAAGSNPASPTNQIIVIEHEGRTPAPGAGTYGFALGEGHDLTSPLGDNGAQVVGLDHEELRDGEDGLKHDSAST